MGVLEQAPSIRVLYGITVGRLLIGKSNLIVDLPWSIARSFQSEDGLIQVCNVHFGKGEIPGTRLGGDRSRTRLVVYAIGKIEGNLKIGRSGLLALYGYGTETIVGIATCLKTQGRKVYTNFIGIDLGI